jgi:hypothetical protein
MRRESQRLRSSYPQITPITPIMKVGKNQKQRSADYCFIVKSNRCNLRNLRIIFLVQPNFHSTKRRLS